MSIEAYFKTWIRTWTWTRLKLKLKNVTDLAFTEIKNYNKFFLNIE